MPAATPIAPVGDPAEAGRDDVPAPTADRRAAPATILVIDDDLFMLSFVRKMLQKASHRVVTAPDATLGIEFFRRQRPALVITDIMMPDKDGIETIRILRGLDAAIPIIAMSGGGRLGFTQILNAAKQLGADETISKPFAPDEFLAVVARVLETKA
jgi:DNA-binding response OmpR family regulator